MYSREQNSGERVEDLYLIMHFYPNSATPIIGNNNNNKLDSPNATLYRQSVTFDCNNLCQFT